MQKAPLYWTRPRRTVCIILHIMCIKYLDERTSPRHLSLHVNENRMMRHGRVPD